MATISALNETSLSELSPALERGDVSSREIVEQCLAAIQARDTKLHAFVKLDAESALALADAADQQRRQGYARGPLHGLPVVLKDLIEVDGEVTTLGSKHFENRRSPYNSATLERLLAAGMIPLGKVHMTEFAFGGWGTNPLMGTPIILGTCKTIAHQGVRRAVPVWRLPGVFVRQASVAIPEGLCAFQAHSMASPDLR